MFSQEGKDRWDIIATWLKNWMINITNLICKEFLSYPNLDTLFHKNLSPVLQRSLQGVPQYLTSHG
jgi:hypothetical protein